MYTDKHRPTRGKGSKWEMYRVILTEVGKISSKLRCLRMYGPRLIRSRGCGKNFQFRYYQRAKFHESESVALTVLTGRGGKGG